MSQKDKRRQAGRSSIRGARRPVARVARVARPQPAPAEELNDLLPGEPGWSEFWLRVRADGDRIRTEMGLEDEAAWRGWLRELRSPPARERARTLRDLADLRATDRPRRRAH